MSWKGKPSTISHQDNRSHCRLCGLSSQQRNEEFDCEEKRIDIGGTDQNNGHSEPVQGQEMQGRFKTTPKKSDEFKDQKGEVFTLSMDSAIQVREMNQRPTAMQEISENDDVVTFNDRNEV